MKPAEKFALAHRYLRHVLDLPLIPKRDYERMERAALRGASVDSSLRKPASERDEDYSPPVKHLAFRLIRENKTPLPR